MKPSYLTEARADPDLKTRSSGLSTYVRVNIKTAKESHGGYSDPPGDLTLDPTTPTLITVYGTCLF